MMWTPALHWSPATIPAAGGGSISSPNDLANLFAWYKADTDVTTPGGLIDTILDQTAGNHDLYRTGGSISLSAYNSTDAIAFPGTGSTSANLAVGPSGGPPAVFGISGNELTFFYIGTFDTVCDAFGRLFSITAGGGNDYETTGSYMSNRDNTNNTITASVIDTGTTSAVTSTLTDDAHHSFCVVFDGSAIQWYIDGSADGTAGSYSGTSIIASNKLVLGGPWLGGGPGSGAYGGLAAEICIYERGLSSSEVLQLHNYAVARVGL